MALKTDYKDDIPVSERRKYQMVDNGDGTVSFVDVTEYSQEGDTFGAADINATNEAVNGKLDGSSTVDPMLATEEGFAADAKLTRDAISELNSNLNNTSSEIKNFKSDFASKIIIESRIFSCGDDGYITIGTKAGYMPIMMSGSVEGIRCEPPFLAQNQWRTYIVNWYNHVNSTTDTFTIVWVRLS